MTERLECNCQRTTTVALMHFARRVMAEIVGPVVPKFMIGERFKSFEDLDKKLKNYEKATSTKFWIRDCRTVNAAMKRTTRSLCKAIKYYQIGYRCIHGGRKFVPLGEGKRSTQ